MGEGVSRGILYDLAAQGFRSFRVLGYEGGVHQAGKGKYIMTGTGDREDLVSHAMYKVFMLRYICSIIFNYAYSAPRVAQHSDNIPLCYDVSYYNNMP